MWIFNNFCISNTSPHSWHLSTDWAESVTKSAELGPDLDEPSTDLAAELGTDSDSALSFFVWFASSVTILLSPKSWKIIYAVDGYSSESQIF